MLWKIIHVLKQGFVHTKRGMHMVYNAPQVQILKCLNLQYYFIGNVQLNVLI